MSDAFISNHTVGLDASSRSWFTDLALPLAPGTVDAEPPPAAEQEQT